MKKVIKILVFAGVAAATLVALFYVSIHLWGRTQWSAAKQELLAKGEPLSIAEFATPPVPEEQDFFATPSWKRYLELEPKRREMGEADFRRENPFSFATGVQDSKTKGLATIPKLSSQPFRSNSQLTDLEAYAQAYREMGVTSSTGPGAVAVLDGLKGGDAVLAELETAAQQRRGGRSFQPRGDVISMTMPHIQPILQMAQVLRLRAEARMAAGDSAGAGRDIVLALALGHALHGEPFLISQLVEISTEGLALAALWDCTARGPWTEAELAAIQAALERCHPIAQVMEGMRMERAAFNEFITRSQSRSEFVERCKLFTEMSDTANDQPLFTLLLTIYPWGLVLGDQAYGNLYIQQVVEALKSRDVAKIEALSDASVQRPQHLISSLWIRALRTMATKALNSQAQLDLGLTACALERYRLVHGNFPERLDSLVPEFLSTVPQDVVTRRPIGYERLGSDNYRLTATAVKPLSENQMPPGGKWRWQRLPQ